MAGGFAQLCHGKRAPLARMQVGDWLVYYSPRTDMDGGAPLQSFTAIGRVTGDAVYQHAMSDDFVPHRVTSATSGAGRPPSSHSSGRSRS